LMLGVHFGAKRAYNIIDALACQERVKCLACLALAKFAKNFRKKSRRPLDKRARLCYTIGKIKRKGAEPPQVRERRRKMALRKAWTWKVRNGKACVLLYGEYWVTATEDADDPRFVIFAVSRGEFPMHRVWRVPWDRAASEARQYAPLSRWRLARD